MLLKKFPENLDVVIMDVTDDQALNQSVDYITQKINGTPLSALINNAGLAVPGPIMLMDDEEFNYQLKVNVLAVRKITGKSGL